MSNTVNKRLVWDVCRTPTEFYALTTYHSQLVLVGGRDREPSHMLWTLSSDTGMNWQPSIIQEMPTKRYAASAMNIGTPEYLVVAGGKGIDGYELDTVEVFTGKEWCTVEPLPQNCCYHKCTLHKGKYLFGGYPQSIAYWCDIKSILKSCEQSGINKAPVYVWSQFEFPLEHSSLASFGQHFISIAGITNYDYRSSDVFAVSPLSQSWIHVGNLSIALYRAASIVLPTGELVVIGGNTGGVSYSASVFKSTLRGEGIVMFNSR